ncbi:MAG: UDP-2,3-diacylglucosamine diphosphatase [Planctomycetota bacterium]
MTTNARAHGRPSSPARPTAGAAGSSFLERSENLEHPNIRPEADPTRRRRLRTVWVSDVHLGARASKAHELLTFLKTVECDQLYLVGDILDFWKLRKRVHWPAVCTALTAHVSRLAESGVDVIYVPGNHDAEFRGHGIFQIAGVSVRNEVIHHTADGRRLLVTHGDAFDDYGEESSWLVAIGDRAYSWTIVVSEGLNVVRGWLGLPHWSLSLWLKQKVKSAVGFVSRFQDRVIAAAAERRVDGVVCGHIHKAELRRIGDVIYANDGDWVESCTALVEEDSGRMELLRWDGSETVQLAELAAQSLPV